MNNVFKISIAASLVVSALNASSMDSFNKMFKDAKSSGELRSVVVGNDNKTATDTYASAVGANLKYELAEANGFNAALGFTVSKDAFFATGDREKAENADELSSSKGEYNVLDEAYINYKRGGLNIRAGRQVIDTPLADSDDIRMVKNTFEAYVASYQVADLTLIAGNIQKWQGVDAGLDDGWQKTGSDGTWAGGAVYADDMIEANAWVYNVTGVANAAYADVAINHELSKGISFTMAGQYLKENELENSGIAANIYGASVEASLYDFGLYLAYSKSAKVAGKTSFSGFGGGALFTSMDTMILDEITADRDASAMLAGLSYSIAGIDIIYAYGDFSGEKDSLGTIEHVVEQDIGLEYSVNEELALSAYFIMSSDEENTAKTGFDWRRVQGTASYSF